MNTLTCAIEFGSANINAIAARRDENGHVTVLAVESEPSNGCVRHGCVKNVEEAASKAKNLITKLSNRLSSQTPTTIGKAYVGIAGISIHSMSHRPSMHLDDGSHVTTETLDMLRTESRKATLEGYDILGVENSYYTLDNQMVLNPIDRTCSEITAHNQLIVARSYLKKQLKATMDRAGIEIAGFITLPLSTAAILNDMEKQQGCILVNFGAETTTVSVYKPSLQHLAVIPLGGEVVTRDIMTNGLSHEKAENAKRWSNAYSANSEIRPSAIEQEAIGMDISTLNNIVQARYEEILANVKHQIDLAGINELNGGYIITGDASYQKGITTMLSLQSNLAVKTRSYTNANITASGTEKRPRYSSLLSMIALATENCEKPRPVVQQQPPVQPQPIQHQPEEPQQPPMVETSNPPYGQQEQKKDDEQGHQHKGGLKKQINRFISDLFRQEE